MFETNSDHPIHARGAIDQMLRTTQQHHVQLSQMADQKASLLFGIEALILTITIRDIMTASVSYWGIALAFSILVSVIFALLAVMPSVRPPKFDPKYPDWLFFSTFAQMNPDEYMEKMWRICQDDTQVYGAIIQDIYNLGQVLYFKKYRFLRISYTIFLLGLIVTFVIAVIEGIFI